MLKIGDSPLICCLQQYEIVVVAIRDRLENVAKNASSASRFGIRKDAFPGFRVSRVNSLKIPFE